MRDRIGQRDRDSPARGRLPGARTEPQFGMQLRVDMRVHREHLCLGRGLLDRGLPQHGTPLIILDLGPFQLAEADDPEPRLGGDEQLGEKGRTADLLHVGTETRAVDMEITVEAGPKAAHRGALRDQARGQVEIPLAADPEQFHPERSEVGGRRRRCCAGTRVSTRRGALDPEFLRRVIASEAARTAKPGDRLPEEDRLGRLQGDPPIGPGRSGGTHPVRHRWPDGNQGHSRSLVDGVDDLAQRAIAEVEPDRGRPEDGHRLDLLDEDRGPAADLQVA